MLNLHGWVLLQFLLDVRSNIEKTEPLHLICCLFIALYYCTPVSTSLLISTSQGSSLVKRMYVGVFVLLLFLQSAEVAKGWKLISWRGRAGKRRKDQHRTPKYIAKELRREALEYLQQYLEGKENGWKPVLFQGGGNIGTKMSVWTRHVPDSDYIEVKATARIPTSPEAVSEILTPGDIDIVRTYNPLIKDGYDVEYLDRDAKISWSLSEVNLRGDMSIEGWYLNTAIVCQIYITMLLLLGGSLNTCMCFTKIVFLPSSLACMQPIPAVHWTHTCPGFHHIHLQVQASRGGYCTYTASYRPSWRIFPPWGGEGENSWDVSHISCLWLSSHH